MKAKVIVITGASSGIGLTCARYLYSKGFNVYGFSRHPKVSDDDGFKHYYMDVCDNSSVEEGFRCVVENEERLDVVVNCAGYGLRGAIEDTSIQEAQAQLDTNFFGTVRVLKSTLPIMRRQHEGLIVNVSSLAGLVALPFQAFYSASKFAMEGMSEALRVEMKPFGVKVVLLEPGYFKTEFFQNRQMTIDSSGIQAYRDQYLKVVSAMDKLEQAGHDPNRIGILLERIIQTSKPRFRYSAGPFDQKFGVFMKRLMPYPLSERILMKFYNLP